jgi:hypothetical protein
MNISNLLEKTNDQDDQLLVVGGVNWQQYLAIDTALESVPGLRLSYCQGLLEIMTLIYKGFIVSRSNQKLAFHFLLPKPH